MNELIRGIAVALDDEQGISLRGWDLMYAAVVKVDAELAKAVKIQEARAYLPKNWIALNRPEWLPN